MPGGSQQPRLCENKECRELKTPSSTMTDWDEFLKNFIQEEKRKEGKEKANILDKSSQRSAAERTDHLKLLSVEVRQSKKTKQDVIDVCDSSTPVIDLCDSSSSEEEEKDAARPPVVVAPQSRDHLGHFAASRRDSGQTVTLDRAQRGSNATLRIFKCDLPANDIKQHHKKTVPLQCPQNGMFEARGPDCIQPLAMVPLRRDHLGRFATSKHVSGQSVTLDRAQRGSNVTEGLPEAPNDIKRHHTKTVPLQCPQNGKFEACGPDSIQAGKRHNRRHYVQESSTTDVSEHPAVIRFVKQCYVRFGSTLGIIEITPVPTAGVTLYICEEDSGQKNKSLLTVRGSMHNVEQPYTCKNCGKNFTKADKLQDHVRIHTRGKPYICEECGQKFGNINILKVHCKMHMAKKPGTCKKCGKSFTSADELKDHVRIHTGGKPYTCKKCGKMFRVLHHFQQHMRAHSGENPFPCPHCGKKFNNERYLTEHNIRKHAGEKPYSCGRCGRGFTASNDLMIHFRRCRAHTSFL